MKEFPKVVTPEWLVKERSLSLHFGFLRYGGGVGGLLAPARVENPFALLDIMTDGGDEHHEIDRIFCYSEWFPMVSSDCIGGATVQLQLKLNKLTEERFKHWEQGIHGLYDKYFELSNQNWYMVKGLHPTEKLADLDWNVSPYKVI